ncbi:unnamed protein product, partial [Symbiodinium sp. CCMP2456]
MSIALRKLAEIKLREEAEEKKEALIPLSKLVIGHPDTEMSRQTCLAIVQYLKRMGLPCELKAVSAEATDPAEEGVDLLYVEVQVAEPLIDIPRMFATYVPNRHQTQYFQLALRQLGESRNWQEVRERFWSLHRLCHDDLLIIPLFQLQDHFVYRRSLGGIGYQPMTLFQQVERWDLKIRRTVVWACLTLVLSQTSIALAERLPWEIDPYRTLISVDVDPSCYADQAFLNGLLEEIQRQRYATSGAIQTTEARAAAVPLTRWYANDASAVDFIAKLDRLGIGPEEFDRIQMVSLRRDGDWEVTFREFDTLTRSWGGTHQVRVLQRKLLPAAILRLSYEKFMP